MLCALADAVVGDESAVSRLAVIGLLPRTRPLSRRPSHLRLSAMCYFEQTRWSCGYWKWGNFRAQCNKEYRTGETCGLKLVYDTIVIEGQCKLCDQIDKKERRARKMQDDIFRWQQEGNRRATVEKTQADVAEIEAQISQMGYLHAEKQRSIC